MQYSVSYSDNPQSEPIQSPDFPKSSGRKFTPGWPKAIKTLWRNLSRSRWGMTLAAFGLLIAVSFLVEGAQLAAAQVQLSHAAREACRWAIAFQGGSDPAVRARLIKNVAVNSLKNDGLPFDYLATTTPVWEKMYRLPGFLGVEVWGFDSFETGETRDSPGAPGLPVRVLINYNAKVNNPLLRLWKESYPLVGETEMINEGVQVGVGNVPPPSFAPLVNGRPASYQPAGIANGLPGTVAEIPVAGTEAPLGSVNPGQLIVKEATISLSVKKTDEAFSQVIQTAADLKGYIVSQKMWSEGEDQLGTITIAVPVVDFEKALIHLRTLGVKVLSEEATGQDVTSEYVDQESHLRSVKLTRSRVEEIMARAETIDQALKINQTLSDLDDQIETAQGQLNYLQNRAAYSKITVSLTPVEKEVILPEVVGWQPGQTLRKALETWVGIGQFVVDLAIWLIVVILPILGIIYLLVFVVGRIGRRRPTLAETQQE